DLIPLAAAALVKPAALVFPALLAAYLWIFEGPRTPGSRNVPRPRIFRSIAPALALTIVLAWWLSHMTPRTATTGASNAPRYLWSQPFVALRYFAMFFWPSGLTADNDSPLVSGPSCVRVAVGLIFAASVLVAIWQFRKTVWSRPASFGLAWFVITLLPTSLTPLAEVANDHRMFFPFVGLSLAVAVVAGRLLRRVPA